MDRYNLTARFYPMMLFYLPVLFMLLTIGWDITKYAQYGTSLGVAGMLSYLLANMGRDAGKQKEPNLWKSWGGAPTTQLFRWSNNVIDVYTKARYHKKMQRACAVPYELDDLFEHDQPYDADEIYRSWTKFVIGQTRDTSKYRLIFKENMSYGFRRNLWGLKPYAIILLLVLMTINYLFFVISVGDWRLECLPVFFFTIESLLFILFLFWIFIVTPKWVSIPAFAYAERLQEAIDTI